MNGNAKQKINDDIGEQDFKRKRRVLIGISSAIILLHTNLSILLNKILQHPFSSEQLDNLSAILFVFCIGAFIRYHQAARSLAASNKVIKSYIPYFRRALGNKGIVLDRTYQGQSEHDGHFWHNLESDDFRSYYYILEQDIFWGGTNLKPYSSMKKMQRNEKVKINLVVLKEKFFSSVKFAIHEPEVFDIIWPYFLGVVAVLEITGILKVSILLQFLGHLFNREEIESNVSNILFYFWNLA